MPFHPRGMALVSMLFKSLVKKSNIWDFPAFSTHPPTPLSLRERGKDKARNELPPCMLKGVVWSGGPVKGHRNGDLLALDRAMAIYFGLWGGVIIHPALNQEIFFWAGGSPIPPGVQPVRERGRRRFGCRKSEQSPGHESPHMQGRIIQHVFTGKKVSRN